MLVGGTVVGKQIEHAVSEELFAGRPATTARLRIAYARLFNSTPWAKVSREYGMSPRETQVSVLMCKGFCGPEIAGHLGITAGTVKVHLRTIYHKMSVTCRERAIVKLLLGICVVVGESELTDSQSSKEIYR